MSWSLDSMMEKFANQLVTSPSSKKASGLPAPGQGLGCQLESLGQFTFRESITKSQSTTGWTSNSSRRKRSGSQRALGPLVKGSRLARCLADFADMPHLDARAGDLVNQAMGFLISQGYHMDDLCLTLSHACVYMQELAEAAVGSFEGAEAGNIMVLLIFIADSHVQDEAPSLKKWHRHLFKKSCSIKTLNLAVIQLLKCRQYNLRVKTCKLNDRYLSLIAAAQGFPGSFPQRAFMI
eukprot:CAMPEP_0170636342 /NCGR_PEP_ID=MMETSP0224-20130122/37745_1 /TAXON_ID=285029 /ORGANISM="Togula jolla, Strain CCCM 725" /LENGTH=236 /DNA_ID=CAMNT_0010965985 /DNA_START=90 /DNA_END=800 /DNA_ORIENTATION=+